MFCLLLPSFVNKLLKEGTVNAPLNIHSTCAKTDLSLISKTGSMERRKKKDFKLNNVITKHSRKLNSPMTQPQNGISYNEHSEGSRVATFHCKS